MGRPAGSRREAQRAGADSGVTTIRAVVEYDGTDFCGLQYQPGVRTVAGVVEATLSRLLGESVKITAAGRTDAGVHATGQVISWKTTSPFPFERLAIAANAELPSDICVREAATVDGDFSARFSAKERTYVYAVINRKQRSALLAKYAYHVWTPIDLARLQSAAARLTGEHDFRSFCGMLPESGPTTRTVRSIDVRMRGEMLRLEIRADGFLHRMVRTLVGTMIECGTGRRDAASMPAVLAARDRTAAGLTAPAHGLYLAGVRYDDFDSFKEPAVTA